MRRHTKLSGVLFAIVLPVKSRLCGVSLAACASQQQRIACVAAATAQTFVAFIFWSKFTCCQNQRLCPLLCGSLFRSSGCLGNQPCYFTTSPEPHVYKPDPTPGQVDQFFSGAAGLFLAVSLGADLQLGQLLRFVHARPTRHRSQSSQQAG